MKIERGKESIKISTQFPIMFLLTPCAEISQHKKQLNFTCSVTICSVLVLLDNWCVPTCAAKTCAVHPVFARVVVELCIRSSKCPRGDEANEKLNQPRGFFPCLWRFSRNLGSGAAVYGDWPNAVSERTVSSTELSEVFALTKFQGESSVSCSQPIICVR